MFFHVPCMRSFLLLINTSLCNSWVPNRRLAINRTTDGLVCWRIYVWLGFNAKSQLNFGIGLIKKGRLQNVVHCERGLISTHRQEAHMHLAQFVSTAYKNHLVCIRPGYPRITIEQLVCIHPRYLRAINAQLVWHLSNYRRDFENCLLICGMYPKYLRHRGCVMNI